ncbi:MAG: hypothetical protein J7J20_03120 [Desulfurococcales archaeon]|nr:hypothetical protein [Desulfurococcales archaeon]
MVGDLPHKVRLYVFAVAYASLVSLVIKGLYGSTEALIYMGGALVITFIPLSYGLAVSLLLAGTLAYFTSSYWMALLALAAIYLSRALRPAVSIYAFIMGMTALSVVTGGDLQRAWAVGLSALMGVLYLVHRLYEDHLLECGLRVTAMALLYTLVIVLLRLMGSIVEGLLILGGTSVSVLLCLKVYEELSEKLTKEV